MWQFYTEYSFHYNTLYQLGDAKNYDLDESTF